MKRIPRQPEKFDTLELFTAVSRNEGYRLDVPADVEAFQARILSSLRATIANPNILHGKRVEAMFAHVAGALGNCRLIKQEDGGATFTADDDLVVPDYRIVTNDDELLLVEVKNFHMKELDTRYVLKRGYVASLAKYAEMNKGALKIAIYFSRIGKWVLLSPEAFFVDGRYLWIDFPHAMARNEMATLGDRSIGTRSPLSMEFKNDSDDERALIAEDGTAHFTIRSITFKSDGVEITDDAEKRIAFYLMRYGSWGDVERPANIVDGRLVSFAIEAKPESPSEDQGFDFIGELSSMVSSAFRELTVEDGAGVISVDVKYDPEIFRLEISKDYKGKELPLWQFTLQPNFEPLKAP